MTEKYITIPAFQHSTTIAFFGTDEEIETAERIEESAKDIYRQLLSDPKFRAFQIDEERAHDTQSIICSRSFQNADGWRLSYLSSVYGAQMHEEYTPDGGSYNGIERMLSILINKCFKSETKIKALFA